MKEEPKKTSIFDLDKKHSPLRKALMEGDKEKMENLAKEDPQLIDAFNGLLMSLCNYYNNKEMADFLKKLGSSHTYTPRKWGK